MERKKSRRRHSAIELGIIGGKLSQLSIIDEEERTIGYRICEIAELILVLLLILLICSILTLPIIFYYVDVGATTFNGMNPMNNLSHNTMEEVVTETIQCTNVYQFNASDQRCHSELMDVLMESDCPHEVEQTIWVSRNGGHLAKQVLGGLELIGARQSCLEEATSFICLYAYGLCSSSGVYIQPTSVQCEELRDSLCQKDWETALLASVPLPNCSAFASTPAICNANASTSVNITETEEKDMNVSLTEMLECSEGFYRENGSQICIPSCYSWHQDEEHLSLAIDIVIIVIASVGTVAALANLVIACLKPKRMCSFPSIFVVYMVLDALIIDILTLVTYVNRSALHCSSRSLLQSLQEVTPYCVITGVLWSYLLFQAAFWWLFHVGVLFWKVFFPFRAHRIRLQKKLKYIHIVCLIVGILLPLATVIASMGEFAEDSSRRADNTSSAADLFISGGLGYSNMRFPAVLCRPSDGNVALFSLILPLAIIQATGSIMLILLLWRIHRISVNKKLRNSSRWFTFGTAEKKILIIFIYFELLASIALVAFTLGSRYADELSRTILEYFMCELTGHNPKNPCNQADVSRLGFPSVYLLSIIIFRLFPVIILLYAVDVKDIIKCKLCRRKKKNKVKSANITKPTNLSSSLATK